LKRNFSSPAGPFVQSSAAERTALLHTLALCNRSLLQASLTCNILQPPSD
jgi:hypothetical protein